MTAAEQAQPVRVYSNRLAQAAHVLRAKIEAGNAKAQNPMFATSTGAIE